MKKILYPLLFAVAMLGITTSCSEDRDSNPVLNTTDLHLVLNTPGLAANNIYDLEHSDCIVLTTSQPEYGFPISTSYKAYMSIDGEEFVPLSTTYQTTRIEVSATEVNEQILSLAGDADLTAPIEVFFKITAQITGQGELGYVESNVVTLPSVLAYVPKVELSLPTQMYIVGSFPASDSWSKFVPLHFAYSQDGFSYGIVYLPEGAEFKINPDDGWKGNDRGFGQLVIGDNNAAGLVGADSKETSNIKATVGGWYTVIVKNKIANGAVQYELNTRPAEVYLFGAVCGGIWEWNEANKFTVPDNEGPWTSPAFTDAGEVRMAVNCGIDWWKTEFTLYAGEIFYRNCDIPHNWSEDLTPEHSVQGNPGGSITLDFTNGTGSVK